MKQVLDVKIPENEWLTANQRMHRFERAKRVKALRYRAWILARQARMEKMSGLVHCTAEIFFPYTKRFDPNNAADATKALIDGLRDAGVLEDDDHSHLVGPDHRWGGALASLGRGWRKVVLTLTSEEES